MENLPKKVRIVEVGPRDGLQNESKPVATGTKVELIERLAAAGLKYIEAGSFVNPQWVPQMADSDQVLQRISRNPDVTYVTLTPNMTGFERALEAGVNEIAVFASASEAFSQKNINCSIEESIARFEPIMKAAQHNGLPVRAYVSCAVCCPYEGDTAPEKVAEVAARLEALGCYEISLCDTIGTGTPVVVERMIKAVAEKVPVQKLAVHMHDTYGQALANILASLQLGIQVIDASVAGLGGCPYARGASGNVATEDVIYMLNGLGIEHGVDLDQVVATGNYICAELSRVSGSKVALARNGNVTSQ